MSETKFTPGPWRVLDKTVAGNQVIAVGDIRLAYLGWGDIQWWPSKDQATANAQLFAAAPDLYNAVEKQHAAIDRLLALLIAKDPEFMPTQSKVWPLLMEVDAPRLLAKARGEA